MTTHREEEVWHIIAGAAMLSALLLSAALIWA